MYKDKIIVNIDKINLNSFIGNKKGRFYTILDVYKNQNEYIDDVDRAMKANLNEPVILFGNKIVEGEYIVLKALILNSNCVFVKLPCH